MSEGNDAPPDDDATSDRPEQADEVTHRDATLSGRNLLAAGRAAAAGGDAGAARALLTAAAGSGDPAVAGEAAAALGQVEALEHAKALRRRRLRSQ